MGAHVVIPAAKELLIAPIFTVVVLARALPTYRIGGDWHTGIGLAEVTRILGVLDLGEATVHIEIRIERCCSHSCVPNNTRNCLVSYCSYFFPPFHVDSFLHLLLSKKQKGGRSSSMPCQTQVFTVGVGFVCSTNPGYETFSYGRAFSPIGLRFCSIQ